MVLNRGGIKTVNKNESNGLGHRWGESIFLSDFWPFVLGIVFVIISNYVFITWKGFAYEYGAHTHSWSAGYYGDYIFNHFNIPKLLNNPNYAVGNVYPMFYGTFFYTIMGVVGHVTNYDFALKFVMCAFTYIQYLFGYKLVHKVSGNRIYSVAMAVLVIFSVYPLTNYFSRLGAYVEWFGNANIWIGAMAWVISMLCENRKKSMWYKMLFLLFMFLGVTGHAITTLNSSYIVVLVMLLSFLFVWNKKDKKEFWFHAKSLLLIGAAVVVMSASWLYMCGVNADRVLVGGLIQELRLYPEVDGWRDKLSPFVHSVRTAREKTGIFDVLSAPINIMMLLIVLFLLVAIFIKMRKERGNKKESLLFLGSCALLGIAAFLIFNTTIWPKGIMSPFANLLYRQQFAYRSVNQINLCLFFALVFTSYLWKKLDIFNRTGHVVKSMGVALVSLSLLFSVFGVMEKAMDFTYFSNFYRASRPSLTAEEKVDHRVMPRRFHGPYAYFVLPEYKQPDEIEGIAEEPVYVQFPVDENDYDNVGEVTIFLEEKSQVNLNVYAFPWNVVYVDGQRYTLDDMYCYTEGNSEALNSREPTFYIVLEAGERHLRYETEFPPLYIWGSNATNFSFMMLILLATGWSVLIGVRNLRLFFQKQNGMTEGN